MFHQWDCGEVGTMMLAEDYLELVKKRRMMPSDTIIIEFSDNGGQGMAYSSVMCAMAVNELWKSYSGSQ